MTDEQVSILTLVEALISPISEQIALLGEQIKSSDATRAQQVAELSERVGKVESRLDVSDAKGDTKLSTLKLVGGVVTAFTAGVAAIGGFVLAIIQAVN